MDRIDQYRQPMVTATGIFLGFMLNFSTAWVKDAFTKYMFRDTVVAISIIVCLFSLLAVLFRMLRMHYPVEPEKFYHQTLILFLIGVTVPFISLLIIVIEKWIERVF